MFLPENRKANVFQIFHKVLLVFLIKTNIWKVMSTRMLAIFD